MKRKQYRSKLKEIGLTPDQTMAIRTVIQDLMKTAEKKASANKKSGVTEAYFSGKADGFNAMDRFFRGDMDCHDEFDE